MHLHAKLEYDALSDGLQLCFFCFSFLLFDLILLRFYALVVVR